MKGYIYGIRDVRTHELIYVGSTQQRLLCMRKGDHTKPTARKRPLHHYIDEAGGWEHFAFECIEENEYETKTDLKKREQHFISQYNPSQNKHRAIRTEEDKREDNRIKSQTFRDNNPTYHRRYADKQKERDKKRYETKIECPCGGRYALNNKSNHFSREIHKRYEVQTHQVAQS
jgi:hypothetical protein